MLISKRRWVHALSYEVILLVIIALALSYVFEMPMQVTGGLGIAMAVTSVLWNMLFNHYFEKFEAKHQLHRTFKIRILHAIGFGMPAVMMYAALRSYSEALGHPRPVTAISLLALLALIPLNLVFMYGFGPIPALGSAGCGFATAILQWLMFITLAIYISRAQAYKQAPIFTQWEKLDLGWTKRILKLGFPIGLAVFFEVSIFSTGAIVLSPLGENAIAAHQIAISVTSQLFMIPLSLAIALTIRVGMYYGEKNWLAMRQVQKVGLISATIFAACTMALIALARPYIVAIYTNDVHIMPIAMYLLWFAIAYQLVDGWQVSAAGCLRGMQDTQAPMWITLMAYWVVAFPIGLYLARYTIWGVAGVWLGLIIGLTIACVLLIGRLYLINKRLMQLKSSNP